MASSSRGKWETMVGDLKTAISYALSDEDKKKEETSLGSGLAEKAKGGMKDYRSRQKKVLDEL